LTTNRSNWESLPQTSLRKWRLLKCSKQLIRSLTSLMPRSHKGLGSVVNDCADSSTVTCTTSCIMGWPYFVQSPVYFSEMNRIEDESSMRCHNFLRFPIRGFSAAAALFSFTLSTSDFKLVLLPPVRVSGMAGLSNTVCIFCLLERSSIRAAMLFVFLK